MDQTTWIVLVALASLVSGAALLTRVDEALWGLPALFVWLLAGYGATNIEIYTGGTLTATRSYPAVALLFGVGGGGIMLMVWLQGAAMAVHPDKQDAELEASPPRK